jgi:4-amino-4-deoxy-L-arabinose transferase-like glycosyltransferase
MTAFPCSPGEIEGQFQQIASPIMFQLKPLLIFLTAVFLIRFVTLGAYPLLDPTEGRYAEIPREMLATGDWVVPYLHNGQPFLGKPPLMFWTTAVSYRIFGANEFAARLPSFLFSTLAALLLFLFARRLRDTVFGLQAVAVLATNFLFCLYSGYVAVDSALLVCVTLSMVAFPLALEGSSHGGSRLWGYLFFLGLGLSLLAKGLAGPVLILRILAGGLRRGPVAYPVRNAVARLPQLLFHRRTLQTVYGQRLGGRSLR